MKKILIFITLFFSFSCFAAENNSSCNSSVCPQALPTNSAGFCASFITVARCHCTSHGLPVAMCQDMNKIYDRMIAIYHSIPAACAAQARQPDGTSVQTCIDDWACYLNGGKDSLGRLCSSTGKSCR